ncbi:MAG: hypothetical protein JJU20_15160, partial [Opitutales bacterium]|nr:hypothetical protein [Opitutales bacterium]
SGLITLYAYESITVGENVEIETAADISLEAETGSIELDGTVWIEATDSTLRLDAEGDVILGNLVAANVSLLSWSGAIVNADDTTLNVEADNLRIEAHASIAASGRHLSVDVDTLTAESKAGSIFITAESGVTVGTVTVTVDELTSEAGTDSSADDSQSGLTTLSAGDIVLVALAGDVVIDDPVSADGEGRIRLEAQSGSLSVDANITSGSGWITLYAETDLNISEAISIESAADIRLDANTGELVMHGTTVVEATDSNLRLAAENDIVVGNLLATNVSILSVSGAIVNAADSSLNVDAEQLRLESAGAIAAADRHLSVDVDKVAALSEQGGIFIASESGLAVGDVEVSVSGLTATAGEISHTDEEVSGLTTLDNGDIILVALTGSIEVDSDVSANGEGRVLVSAEAGALTVNADILSDTGLITLQAETAIEATESVVIESAADVSLAAQSEGITLDGTVNITATDSSLRLAAKGSIELGNLSADNVSVLSSTGSISNATGSTLNVDATLLRLEAADTIGVADRHLSVNVDTLTAVSSESSIFLTAMDAVIVGSVEVTVTRFTETAGTETQTDEDQSGLTTLEHGDIVLVAESGSIVVDDIVDAHGEGRVLITADTGTLSIEAHVLSGSGLITLHADGDLEVGESIQVESAADISLKSVTGGITLHGTATVEATDSNLRLAAEGDIVLGNLIAANASIVSHDGSVLNAAESMLNVEAQQLRLEAHADIGEAGRHLTVDIDTLTADSSEGSIFLSAVSGATVGTVEVTVSQFNRTAGVGTESDSSQSGLVTGNEGDIIVVADSGNITVNDIVSADGEGRILLDVAAGELTINAAVSSDTGRITLTAQGEIEVTESISIESAADIHLKSHEAGILLDGTATITATDSNLRLAAEGTIHLGNLIAAKVSVRSHDGAITNAEDSTLNVSADELRLEAQGSIAVADRHLSVDVDTLTAESKAGSIFITAEMGVVVGTVTVTVEELTSEAGTDSSADDNQSGLTTLDDGDIVLVALTGDVVIDDAVSADGEGRIRLEAQSGALSVDANITSGSGWITLYAETDLSIGEAIEIESAADIRLDAITGELVMHGTAVVEATDSSMRLAAENDIVVGNLLADNVSILSVSGVIVNAADSSLNVDAEQLRIESTGAIAAADRHLSVDVDELAALSEEGGIFITSNSGLTVGDVEVSVSGLTATAGEVGHTDEELSGLTTLDNGDIILVALTGSIEVDSDVSADGEGRVLLSAETDALTVNADILSDTGLITLYAETAIEATESVVIESAADISLTAQSEGITL